MFLVKIDSVRRGAPRLAGNHVPPPSVPCVGMALEIDAVHGGMSVGVLGTLLSRTHAQVLWSLVVLLSLAVSTSPPVPRRAAVAFDSSFFFRTGCSAACRMSRSDNAILIFLLVISIPDTNE